MVISVTLEPIRPGHAVEMFDGLSGQDAYRFLSDDPPAALAELAGRYERQARGRSDDGTELWYNWIVRDASTGDPLGYTQATIQGRSALVAYHVFPAHWRSGIGGAAMTETLNRIFCQLYADRAWALVDTRNAASIALLRKLGFNATGHHQGADFFKGETSDEYKFESSRRAWSDRCSTKQQAG